MRAASSGCLIASRMFVVPLRALYSGRERPAWRMNQTGIRSTGSDRQARRNGAFVRFDTRIDSAPDLRQAANLDASSWQPNVPEPSDLQSEQAHIDRAY